MRPDSPGQFAGAGIGHDLERQRRRAAIHDPAVLHEERAATALQRSGQSLDRDIAGRSRHLVPTASMCTTLTASSAPWKRLSKRKCPATTPSPMSQGSSGLRLTSNSPFTCCAMRLSAAFVDRHGGAGRRRRPVPVFAPSTASVTLRSSRIPMPAGPVSSTRMHLRVHRRRCSSPCATAPAVTPAAWASAGSFPDRSVR